MPRFSRPSRSNLLIVLAAAAVAGLLALPAPAGAQDVINKEAAAALKASFLADLDTMQKKYVGLAEAFPPDKYTWRPMEGVLSVSEVLMLVAFEGYSFVPTSFGAKPADLGSREEAAKLRTLSDKTQVIAHLNKGFAHAKQAVESVDPATLTGKRKLMGAERSTIDAVVLVGGDMHEHLGQLIAYARMNQIVPPWSK
jgi:DinB superfamily